MESRKSRRKTLVKQAKHHRKVLQKETTPGPKIYIPKIYKNEIIDPNRLPTERMKRRDDREKGKTIPVERWAAADGTFHRTRKTAMLHCPNGELPRLVRITK